MRLTTELFDDDACTIASGVTVGTAQEQGYTVIPNEGDDPILYGCNIGDHLGDDYVGLAQYKNIECTCAAWQVEIDRTEVALGNGAMTF